MTRQKAKNNFRIIFKSDNYSQERREEAAQRRLSNAINTPETLNAMDILIKARYLLTY
jgi:glutamine synthetase type III